MATDATGTPTSLGIPKYDPDNDAPSGLGFNAAMDAIDTLIAANPNKPAGIVSGEAVIYNGTTWVRSTTTNLGLSSIAQGGATSGQVLTWNGSSWAPSTISAYPQTLERVTAALDINTTVTETDVYSYSVAGNAMGTDKGLRLTLFGDYLHNNGAGDTVTWRVKFGGTTIFQDTENFNAEANANRQPWRLDLNLVNAGATNSQFLNVLYTRDKASQAAPTTGIGNATFNAYIAGGNLFANSTAAAIDTTTSQTLAISAQWSASSANNSLRRRYAVLELV